MAREAGEAPGQAAEPWVEGARRAAVVLARAAVPVRVAPPMRVVLPTRVAAPGSSSIPAFCTEPRTSTA